MPKRKERQDVVLVGTYRPENEAWIRERRLYNLPLPEFVSHIDGRAACPHAAAYALYELAEESTPAKLLGRKTAEVFVSSSRCPCVKIGEALRDMMGANGWKGLDAWVARANKIAQTIVGGSKKHGGPDLGPTRARRAWDELGVDGLGVANEPPAKDFVGNPKLTKEMIARIQGFPSNWSFGKRIAEEELNGAERAEYGTYIIDTLAAQLTESYGKGFDRRSLYMFLQFFKRFPIVDSLSPQSGGLLSWTHYRKLLQVENPDALRWYIDEAAAETWGVRTLQRNISSQYYERMLLSQHKDIVKSEMHDIPFFTGTNSCSHQSIGCVCRRKRNLERKSKRRNGYLPNK